MQAVLLAAFMLMLPAVLCGGACLYPPLLSCFEWLHGLLVVLLFIACAGSWDPHRGGGDVCLPGADDGAVQEQPPQVCGAEGDTAVASLPRDTQGV